MENRKQASVLCKSGCGFYGSVAFSGFCSKCFKDKLNKEEKQLSSCTPPLFIDNESSRSLSASPIRTKADEEMEEVMGKSSCILTNKELISESNSEADTEAADRKEFMSNIKNDVDEVCDHNENEVTDHASTSSSKDDNDQPEAVEIALTSLKPGVEAAQQAQSICSLTESISSSDLLSNSSVGTCPEISATIDSSNSAQSTTKKPNRCYMCKKRIGLTGFLCRCGGLFCGEHRYDSAHSCSFDYKTMEREEIRKNNPVIVSEKIQRI